MCQAIEKTPWVANEDGPRVRGGNPTSSPKEKIKGQNATLGGALRRTCGKGIAGGPCQGEPFIVRTPALEGEYVVEKRTQGAQLRYRPLSGQTRKVGGPP